MASKLSFLLFGFVALVTHCVPLSGSAQSTQDASVVVRQAMAAVVVIRGSSASGESTGSGFVIAPDGTIVTCLHVIKDLSSGAVQLANGDVFDSFSVRAFDERRDLAIIQIAGFDLSSLAMGNANQLQAGEPVLLIGSPLGLDRTITTGVVSAIRDLEGVGRIIQTDAAANPGNSGGPLLNSRGEAIGVLDSKLRDAENLNFAVSINYVQGMLNNLQGPMGLDELRAKLGRVPEFFSKSGGFPVRWKSLASGTTKLLRVEGERIYIETVLPQELQNQGDFILAEVVKQGEKYVGTITERHACQGWSYWGFWKRGNSNYVNTCTASWDIELASVTATRIEGRAESPAKGAKFDCGKCSFSKKPVWTPFVWIPE